MGNDDFSRSIRNFQRKLENAAAPENVSLIDLMHPGFMQIYTHHPDFESFMTAGGYTMDADEFLAIPDAEFDTHVRRHSQFASWLEMQKKAGELYMAAKIKRALR